MSVTGCRVGKRSFKLADTGKVAASFIHMESFQGVRIIAVKDIQDKIAARYPGIEEKAAQKKAYREMTDRELFQVQEVMVQLQPEDTPGIPAQAAPCAICGETILDRREVLHNGTILCRPCATGNTYYSARSAMREPKPEGQLPCILNSRVIVTRKEV